MSLNNFCNRMRNIFKRKALAGVNLEGLERERNRLHTEEEKLHAEVDEIDLRERQLLDEGRVASNPPMRKRIAVKVKEGRDRRKTLDQRLSIINKSLRIATGLYTIKENETFYKSAGLGGVLEGIPLAHIVAYIEQSPAGAEQTVDGMRDLLESLDGACATLDETIIDSTADTELEGIMSEFTASSCAETKSEMIDSQTQTSTVEKILPMSEPK